MWCGGCLRCRATEFALSILRRTRRSTEHNSIHLFHLWYPRGAPSGSTRSRFEPFFIMLNPHRANSRWTSFNAQRVWPRGRTIPGGPAGAARSYLSSLHTSAGPVVRRGANLRGNPYFAFHMPNAGLTSRGGMRRDFAFAGRMPSREAASTFPLAGKTAGQDERRTNVDSERVQPAWRRSLIAAPSSPFSRTMGGPGSSPPRDVSAMPLMGARPFSVSPVAGHWAMPTGRHGAAQNHETPIAHGFRGGLPKMAPVPLSMRRIATAASPRTRTNGADDSVERGLARHTSSTMSRLRHDSEGFSLAGVRSSSGSPTSELRVRNTELPLECLPTHVFRSRVPQSSAGRLTPPELALVHPAVGAVGRRGNAPRTTPVGKQSVSTDVDSHNIRVGQRGPAFTNVQGSLASVVPQALANRVFDMILDRLRREREKVGW